MPPSPRNASELLFEEYLTEHDYNDWSHEPAIEGKIKNPDYLLNHAGDSHIFEAKEFDGPILPPGFAGAYNPYRPIRAKINQAARQFKEYKVFSCSLVLANPKSAFVRLDDPLLIFGAMLGNLGFQIPVGFLSGEDQPSENGFPEEPIEQVFRAGGKMINYQREAAQNTTISSIIVICTYPLRQRRMQMALDNSERESGKPIPDEDAWTATTETAPVTNADRVVRAIVHENPYARIPLSRDLFVGPFDERWGAEGEFIKRLYVGAEASRFEEAFGER